MTAAEFRRIALSLDGAEEGSHMGALRTAWKLRLDKNVASKRTKRVRGPRT